MQHRLSKSIKFLFSLAGEQLDCLSCGVIVSISNVSLHSKYFWARSNVSLHSKYLWARSNVSLLAK